MSDTIRDYSSIYNIKDFMINQVAAKYFPMDDISLMNVGLMGYITDTQATTTEDVFNTVSRYIIESLPDKARLPEFIYANGASYGISDIFASCSKMPVFLFLKEKDVLNKGTTIGGYNEFTIDSDMILFVEDIPFAIPYNIIIRSSQYKGIYHHQCIHDVSFVNSVASLTSPYIKTIKTVIGGETYIMLAVDVYQYTKVKHHENIINNNRLNIPYVDVTIDGSVCNFEVMYKEPGSTQLVQLQKFTQNTPPSKTPFVYYKVIDDTTMRFYFTNDDRYFIPSYNSELTIELYMTNESEGDFSWYKGNDVMVVASSEKVELDYNNDLLIMATTRGDSAGGKAKLSLEEIRRLTLEKRITIDSYTTDTDLDLFFLNYTNIYNTEAKFIKQRDDFSRRIFGCFSILKNSTDIYPTNTLNIKLGLDDIDYSVESLNKFIIKAGSKFKYESKTELNTAVRVKSEEEINDLDFCYTSIPLISIAKDPTNVAMYINSIDKSISMDYEYINNDSFHQFIVSDCKLYRDAVHGDDSYKLTLRLTSSLDLTASEGTSEALYKNMKVLLVFTTDTGHYIELDFVNMDEETGSFEFECSIDTDDLIHNNKINLINLKSVETGKTESRMINMTDPAIEIRTYFRYEDVRSLNNPYTISELDGYTMTNTYKPIEGSLYFAYCMNLMTSTVKFTPNDANSYDINLSEVPLFASWFLESRDSSKDVLDKLVSQHNFLTDVGTRHTSNYSINMKFYNTFGKSRWFKLYDERSLDRVNCKLHFKIKYNDNILVENYSDEIKIFIKNQIEEINGLASGINEIHISNIITEIMGEFGSVIKYIQFVNINDYDSSVQGIMTKDISDSEKVKMIPEYLTIRLEDIILTTL